MVFCFFGVFWWLASYDHWGVEFVCYGLYYVAVVGGDDYFLVLFVCVLGPF